MPYHALVTADRAQMIEARLMPPSLRVVEFKLEADAAHLLVLASGKAEIVRGDTHLTLGASELIWLPPGRAGQFRLQAGSRGARLKATEIGLAHAMPTGTTAIGLREMLHRVLCQPLSEPERRDAIGHIEAIIAENYGPAPGSDIIIGNLLSVILIRIWRRALADVVTATPMPRSIVERFVLLLTQHKREQWPVEAYARRIGVSRERLSSAIRRATGLSPQAYIHRETLSDARDMLLNTSLQVSEIAFRLGFQDPAYFNRFFTRAEGISPGRFRRSSTNIPKPASPSYAAWP